MIEYFIYNGHNSKIKSTTSKANEILNSDAFYEKIKNKEGGYLYSNCAGSLIAAATKSFRTPIEVVIYKSKNPWTSANGYFTPSKPHTVHLNTRKLGRSNASIVATKVHEFFHAVDAKEEHLSFGHKDNKHTPEKEDCAPFYADFIAENMVNPLVVVQDLESYKIKFVPIWYKRVFMPWTWF